MVYKVTTRTTYLPSKPPTYEFNFDSPESFALFIFIAIIVIICIVATCAPRNVKWEPSSEIIVKTTTVEEVPSFYNFYRSPTLIEEKIEIIEEESPRFVFNFGDKKAKEPVYDYKQPSPRKQEVNIKASPKKEEITKKEKNSKQTSEDLLSTEGIKNFKSQFGEFKNSINELRTEIMKISKKRSFDEKKSDLEGLEKRLKGINSSLGKMIKTHNPSLRNSKLNDLLGSTIEESKEILRNFKEIRQELKKSHSKVEFEVALLCARIRNSSIADLTGKISSELNKY